MEESVNTIQSKEDNNNTLWVIIGVIIAIILIGGIVYFLYSYNQKKTAEKAAQEQALMQAQKEQEEMQAQLESQQQQVEQMEREIAEMQQKQIRNKVLLISTSAEAIRQELSTTATNSLDQILAFIESDESVVLKKLEELPSEIQTAIATVKKEISTKPATGVADSTTSKTITTKSGETFTLTEGETYPITGIIEKYVVEDTSDESQTNTNSDQEAYLGNPYILTTSNGYELLLLFNDTNAEKIDTTMLGKQVDLTVEVTGINDVDKYITYRVVSGPTLSQTQTTTPETTETQGE